MRINSMVVVQGPQKGLAFELPVGIVTVGREQTNSVQISDPEVSRRHAELHFQDDRFVVVDLGSSNGVFVNDVRVKRKILSAGDEVRMGGTTLLFHGQASESNAPSSSRERGTSAGDRGMPQDASPAETILGLPVAAETVDWIAQAKSNLQVMCETAMATSLHTEMDLLIERLMDLVFSWIAADRACVILWDETLGDWVVKSTRQRAKSKDPGFSFYPCRAILDYVREQEEGIFSANHKEDSRWVGDAADMEGDGRSVMCVPIRGSDEITGLIYVECDISAGNGAEGSSPPAFQPDQLKMLLAIGHQAAVAIENTGYYSMMLQRERNIAVGEVMESLSHYIKNVMQSINGGAHLIECGLKEEQYDLVEQGWMMVQRNQEYLSGLVMDMLAHSQPAVPNLSRGDLCQLLRATLRGLERRADYHHVKLEWELGREAIRFRFDYALLERAFQNVLLTGINTCREEGVVSLSMDLETDLEQVVVTIRNSGSEMRSEEFGSMFDPLSVNENSNLMGIAMSVSENSFKAHGGSVDVAREADSGIVFKVTLPLEPNGG
ncbi:MAG: FHA domain-containing protein [Planctomycetota bacterium]|nr:FHA domain-containing protein [Planctomycetota bacterium]